MHFTSVSARSPPRDTLTGYNIPISAGPGIEYTLDGEVFTWARRRAWVLGLRRTYLNVGGVIGYFTTWTQ